MRVRTWSACVALAWGILLIITAAGSSGSFRLAQATTRIAGSDSSTSSISTTNSISGTPSGTIRVTLADRVTPSATTRADASAALPTGTGTVARLAATPAAETRPATYVVQPGDTLSGIAAAAAVPGGWLALYAANRQAIGPDPGLIRPGATLILPGPGRPSRYRVAAGDTLSGIATALGIRGGWRALYAADRQAIGPDPNALRIGTVLTIPLPRPTPTASRPSRPTPTGSRSSSPSTPASAHPSAQSTASAPPGAPAQAGAPAPASSRTPRHPQPSRRAARTLAPITGGLPRWLLIVLIAAGILIAIAFLTEPVLALTRRRQAARQAAAQTACQAARRTRDGHIVLADYERLVVTHSRHDGTVYVLRPPDADPHAILLAARLVLAQDRYEALAGHLGVPAHWPAE